MSAVQAQVLMPQGFLWSRAEAWDGCDSHGSGSTLSEGRGTEVGLGVQAPQGMLVAVQPPPSHTSFSPQVRPKPPQAGPPCSQTPSLSIHGVRLPLLPCPQRSQASRNKNTQVGSPSEMGPDAFPNPGSC